MIFWRSSLLIDCWFEHHRLLNELSSEVRCGVWQRKRLSSLARQVLGFVVIEASWTRFWSSTDRALDWSLALWWEHWFDRGKFHSKSGEGLQTESAGQLVCPSWDPKQDEPGKLHPHSKTNTHFSALFWVSFARTNFIVSEIRHFKKAQLCHVIMNKRPSVQLGSWKTVRRRRW